MHKQAKLRAAYRKCTACGGSGTPPAAVHDGPVRLSVSGSGEAGHGESPQVRRSFKPLYRPIDDPNAADPFVEDPFSGFAPLRWQEARNRRDCDGSASVSRKSESSETLVYNACYLGQGDDHRVWLEWDDASRPASHAHAAGLCGECDGKGVVRVELRAELSLAPTFILLGVASCAAAYTERPLLTAAVYGAAMLAARIVRFKTERYFVQGGSELYTAKRKAGIAAAAVQHECKCGLADSYNV